MRIGVKRSVLQISGDGKCTNKFIIWYPVTKVNGGYGVEREGYCPCVFFKDMFLRCVSSCPLKKNAESVMEIDVDEAPQGCIVTIKNAFLAPKDDRVADEDTSWIASNNRIEGEQKRSSTFFPPKPPRTTSFQMIIGVQNQQNTDRHQDYDLNNPRSVFLLFPFQESVRLKEIKSQINLNTSNNHCTTHYSVEFRRIRKLAEKISRAGATAVGPEIAIIIVN